MISVADMDLYNSLPDASPHLQNMILAVKTKNPGQTVTLPISNTTGLSINWGEDESSDFQVQDGNPNPSFNYLTANTYEVQIKGTAAPGASIGIYVDIEEIGPEIQATLMEFPVVGIRSWGENGFSKFYNIAFGLEEEIPLPTKNSFKHVEEFNGTFMFMGIKSLIEAGVSDPREVLPSVLFEIPENFFGYCPQVKFFENMFFQSFSLIGNIPERLFNNCSTVESFHSTFHNCFNLEGNITLNLFSKCNNVTNFQETFAGCNNLVGMAPAIWERANVLYGTHCFLDCHNLTNYQSVPYMWGGPG